MALLSNRKYILLFVAWAMISFESQSQEFECSTGETFQLPQGCTMRVVRSLKDGSIVYAQDHDGKLHAFEIIQEKTLQRQNICQLPFIGPIYSWLYNNTLELGRDPCHPNPWALGNTLSEGTNIFELVNSYPIEIRNRGPWIPPWVYHTHHGPFGVVGVNITAMNKWVVVSGYTPDRRKVFAVRELNNDLAGHNFLARYTLPKGEWKPNSIYSWLANKLGFSQKAMKLPLADWAIYDLPKNAEPGVTLKEMLHNTTTQLLLEIPLSGGESYAYFDVEKKEYKTHLANHFPHYQGKSWPCEEECRFVLAMPEEIKRKATLNEDQGIVTLSSQEPLYGVFMSTQGKTTNIYYTVRSLWDLLTGHKTFVDEVGTPLNLTFS